MSQPRKVLFVCGFNPTASSWNPHYNAVRAYFDATPGIGVDYYTYMSTERPESVYAGLCAALKKETYDTVVGHSLGCTLVAQYLTRHPKALAAFTAVVMCMPLITTDNKFHATALSVPFFEFVPIPLMLFDALYDENFWTYERYAESFDDVRKKLGGAPFETPFGRCAEPKRRPRACVSETESESDSESDHEELECGSRRAQPRREHESTPAEHGTACGEREPERACCATKREPRRRERKPERGAREWACERELERPCPLRDAMTVFCTHQLKFAYTTWIPELDLRFLGAPNVHVIYASEDSMAPIDPCTLARVRNLRCVTGMHAAFNACRSSRVFFAALAAALTPAAAAPAAAPKNKK